MFYLGIPDMPPTSVVIAKSANNKVQLVTDETRLRLRWSPPGLNRTSLSLGLQNTPANRIRGLEVAQKIEDDMLAGHYDVSKQRYKLYFGKPKVNSRVEGVVPIADLIKKVADYKLSTKQITEATYRNYYLKLNRWLIKNCEGLNESEIYNLILEDKKEAPYTAKFFIDYIRTSYNWAIAQGITEVNPFLNSFYPKALMKKKSGNRLAEPYTRKERDEIIKAFEEHPYYKYYAPYVKFGFFTGARGGEISGLRKSKVSLKNKLIIFDESVSLTLDGFRITEGCKTETRRSFPINGQLEKIIQEATSRDNPWNSPLLFPGPHGGRFINQSNFRKRVWYKVLDKYTNVPKRSPYAMRDTFITMCLEAGLSIELLAYRCGTSAQIIREHYADFSQSVHENPEI